MEILIYIVAGSIAGLMAGLLGLGGGIVVVPSLSFAFAYMHYFPKTAMHVAIGTSLMIMVVTTASSGFAHFRRGNVCWLLFLRLVIGIIMGVVLGAFVADFLVTGVLSIIFGGFLCIAGSRLCYTSFFASHQFETGQPVMPGIWSILIISPTIGFFSGLLGIGTGTISVPYLSQYHYPMKNIAATSSLCSVPVAITGAVSYLVVGLGDTHAGFTTGYVYWKAFLFVAIGSVIFAPIGARLSSVINSLFLKRCFTIVIFLLAIKMFWSGIVAIS